MEANTLAYPKVGTATNTLIARPMDQRHWPIQFSDDPPGTASGPACTCYPINYEELYNLKGRLLTLIDATFTDPQQRKAQKDITWQALQLWMHDIERAAGEEPFGVTHHDDSDPT